MKTIAMIVTLTGAVALSTSAFAGGGGGCSNGQFSKWHADKSASKLADGTSDNQQTATQKQ